jgi:hypothetical protein
LWLLKSTPLLFTFELNMGNVPHLTKASYLKKKEEIPYFYCLTAEDFDYCHLFEMKSAASIPVECEDWSIVEIVDSGLRERIMLHLMEGFNS